MAAAVFSVVYNISTVLNDDLTRKYGKLKGVLETFWFSSVSRALFRLGVPFRPHNPACSRGDTWVIALPFPPMSQYQFITFRVTNHCYVIALLLTKSRSFVITSHTIG
jgi:hypothetical protein